MRSHLLGGRIGHANIGIIFLCIGNPQWCLYNNQSKSDWLFNTKSRVLQADLMILENNEKATLHIYMCYWIHLWGMYYYNSKNKNGYQALPCTRKCERDNSNNSKIKPKPCFLLQNFRFPDNNELTLPGQRVQERVTLIPELSWVL